MLALQVFGAGAGVLAALIISSITYPLWSHPYAIVIMTFEVMAVGWLTTRRHQGLVLADAIYWCLIGIPLTFLFYYGVMHVAVSNASITMLKQAINGIANALIARFIFMAVSYRLRQTVFPLREVTFNIFVLFVLFPSLLFMAVQSKKELAENDRAIRESFSFTSHRTVASLEYWLQDNLKHVLYLAGLAGDHSVSYVQARLEEAQAQDKGFLRIGLLDKNATIVAYAPLVDELGHLNIGKNFADRPFIPVLKKTLKPMLSEIVMGRIGTPKPMATMLAPVVSKGQYAGYMTAILNLQEVEKIIALYAKSRNLPGLNYTLVDKKSKVILSSRNDLEAMSTFVRSKGELTKLGGGLSQWLPEGKKNISISDRWGKSVYIAESEIGGLSEWKLILEQPIEPFQINMYTEYSALLTRLFIILLIALALAQLLSKQITVPLERLKTISSGLPSKLSSGEDVVWDSSRILEVEQLIENFREMIHTLHKAYAEVEMRVQERTAALNAANTALTAEITYRRQAEKALLASEKKYRLLFDIAPVGIGVADLEGNILAANRAMVKTFGYTLDEMQHMIVGEAYVNPDERAQIIDEVTRKGLVEDREVRLKRKDGTIYDALLNISLTDMDGRKALFTMVLDITEHKLSEQQIKQSLREKEALLREIHHRVKNNMAVVSSLLSLQAKTIKDDTVRSLFEESQQRVRSMALVHEKLYQTKDLSAINFEDYIKSIISEIISLYRIDTSAISIEIKIEDIELDLESAVPCGLIINELLTNAFKHAFHNNRSGVLGVHFTKSEDTYTLTIKDNGAGLPEGFNYKEAKTLGLRLVNVLTNQLRGTLEIKSDKGTEAVVKFKTERD